MRNSNNILDGHDSNISSRNGESIIPGTNCETVEGCYLL